MVGTSISWEPCKLKRGSPLQLMANVDMDARHNTSLSCPNTQHSARVLLCNDIFDSISSSFTCVCLVCILQGRLTTEHDLLVTSTFGKTQPMKLSTMPWHPLKWIFSPWVNYQVLRICFWLIRFDSNPSRSAWGCPATQKTWCSWARDLIFSIGENTYRVVVLIHTMWGPRVRSWSINPMKVI